MVRLVSKTMKNRPLVTKWGKIQFDAQGVAEVEDEVGEKLSQLDGYSLEGEDSTPDDSKQQDNEDTTSDEQKNDDSQKENSEQESDDEESTVEDEEESTTDDEAGADAQGDEEKPDLSGMNVAQLRKFAKDNNIEIPAGVTKRDAILEVINKATK